MKITIDSIKNLGLGVDWDDKQAPTDEVIFGLAMGFLTFCTRENFSKEEMFTYLEECLNKVHFDITLAAEDSETLEMLKKDYEQYRREQEKDQ